MRLFISGQSAGVTRPSDEGAWGHFYRAISAQGFGVVDSMAEADAFVAMNHQAHLTGWAARQGIRLARRCLVAWESPAIRPSNFSSRNLRKYGHHIGFSPLWPGVFANEWLPWPQGQPFGPDCLLSVPDWEARDPRAVLVCRNTLSVVSGTNYVLRRHIAFRAGETGLHLRGASWPTNRIADVRLVMRATINAVRYGRWPSRRLVLDHFRYSPQHRGFPVSAKLDLLRGFRVALVIENSSDYVSEKLFDAISAGCVPVYVGPDLAAFGLDPDIAIQVRGDATELLSAMSAVTRRDAERVGVAHRRFVEEQLERWDARTVLAQLAERIVRSLSDDQGHRRD